MKTLVGLLRITAEKTGYSLYTHDLCLESRFQEREHTKQSNPFSQFYKFQFVFKFYLTKARARYEYLNDDKHCLFISFINCKKTKATEPSNIRSVFAGAEARISSARVCWQLTLQTVYLTRFNKSHRPPRRRRASVMALTIRTYLIILRVTILYKFSEQMASEMTG